jgi:phosphoribosylamine--glycine ligase
VNILVIGSGGREHAMCWKLKQSPNVTRLFCAPGNGGIRQIAETVPVQAHEIDSLLKLAKKEHIDLTVVGPEQSLALGIVDVFRNDGLRIFGPTKLAAQLESSKIFAKDFMVRHSIPTAHHRSFVQSDEVLARTFIDELSAPIVVKADGLAAGKGVIICASRQEAVFAVRSMTKERIFGAAGERVVVEEFLSGEEASFLVITDGENLVSLAPAQDHKRIFDGDKGKNTGGMGAYAPAPLVDERVADRVTNEIVLPTIRGMKSEGIPFSGCLYIGLIITASGPKVVEYNCRFGDPEAQVIIPLIDADFAELLFSTADGKLAPSTVQQHPASAVCVVMASQGYPDEYQTGKRIFGLEKIQPEDGVVVFHAGTKMSGEQCVTSGGRVLGVTAIGYEHALEETIRTAYSAVEKITFDGAYFRGDIGKKGLKSKGS